MKSCFKKVVNQKGNEWWQVGGNSRILPEKWVHLGKVDEGYEVRANKKINPETIYGHAKFFKSQSSARKFVNNYMKENC